MQATSNLNNQTKERENRRRNFKKENCDSNGGGFIVNCW